jgi:hypothetical protein
VSANFTRRWRNSWRNCNGGDEKNRGRRFSSPSSQPGRVTENSPPIYRWGRPQRSKSRQGRKKILNCSTGGLVEPVRTSSFAPPGLWRIAGTTQRWNRWAIIGCPSGTKASAYALACSGAAAFARSAVASEDRSGIRVSRPVLLLGRQPCIFQHLCPKKWLAMRDVQERKLESRAGVAPASAVLQTAAWAARPTGCNTRVKEDSFARDVISFRSAVPALACRSSTGRSRPACRGPACCPRREQPRSTASNAGS